MFYNNTIQSTKQSINQPSVCRSQWFWQYNVLMHMHPQPTNQPYVFIDPMSLIQQTCLWCCRWLWSPLPRARRPLATRQTAREPHWRAVIKIGNHLWQQEKVFKRIHWLIDSTVRILSQSPNYMISTYCNLLMTDKPHYGVISTRVIISRLIDWWLTDWLIDVQFDIWSCHEELNAMADCW